MKIIEDAKSLIRSVDPSITLSEFIVYKVNYGRDCWFHYDKKRQERCVFISLKTLLKYGEDACFMCVLHELLHSQNIKPNMGFFKRSYLEGINQFFTLWLIENYSDKYNVPDVVTFRIRVIGIKIGFQAYDKEVARVKKVIEKENVDLKEMFLNYLNMNSAYFKEFIPLNWYK